MSIDERTKVKKARIGFTCKRCDAPTDGLKGTKRFAAGLCRDCFGKGKDRRPRELNELSGKEWAQASCSVAQYPDTRSEKQRLHGACFPLSLAREQIEIYTRTGQTVLDPFVGVGTTIDACEETGRRGVGIELNPEFADVAREGVALMPGGHQHRVIVGDACQMQEYIPRESVDFLLTSPPYGPLLKNVKGAFAYKWQEHSTIDAMPNPAPYSDRSEDLGNLPYEDFLDRLTVCLQQSRLVLRSNAYAVWVVKDFRALKQGVPLVNFHGQFIDRAVASGFTLWDLRIYDQTKFRPLVCLGYPSKNFYLNIGHSYLVVLRKQ